jgi:hypothetical protein
MALVGQYGLACATEPSARPRVLPHETTIEALSERWEAFWDIHGWPARVLFLLLRLATGGTGVAF